MHRTYTPLWEKVGVTLPGLSTAAEAVSLAELNYPVLKRAVLFDGTPLDAGGSINLAHLKVFPRSYVTVRGDNMTPLGLVGEKYKPIQNIDAFSWMDEVTACAGGPEYVAGGVFRGGLRAWLLCKFQGGLQITDKDLVENYVLLLNTHDRSSKADALWVPVRKLSGCVLSIPSTHSRAGKHRLRRIGVDGSHAGDASNLVKAVQTNTSALFDHVARMVAYVPTPQQAAEMLRKVLPPPSGKATFTAQNDAIHQQILELWHHSPANILADDTTTLWALYNAILEYCDFIRPVRPTVVGDADEERLLHAWFGQAAEIKQAAYTHVLAQLNR
jgi:phage/plasmid-like protein (TIGR03299 family)